MGRQRHPRYRQTKRAAIPAQMPTRDGMPRTRQRPKSLHLDSNRLGLRASWPNSGAASSSRHTRQTVHYFPAHVKDPGFRIFNGDGTGTIIVTLRLGGETVLENEVNPLTYTVNPDCTGSFTQTNGPSFGMFIAPDGASIASIATDPPGNQVSGIAQRVSDE